VEQVNAIAGVLCCEAGNPETMKLSLLLYQSMPAFEALVSQL